MNGQFWWYVARASGLVAWLLAGAAVLAHLAGRARPERRLAGRVAAQRGFLEVLALTLAALHGLAVLADSRGPAAGLSVADALLPFASPWEPVALAWGIAALLGAVAVVAAPVVARRHRAGTAIGRWGSLAVFAAATVHALSLPGTDLDRPAPWWGAAAIGALVVAMAITGARRARTVDAVDDEPRDDGDLEPELDAAPALVIEPGPYEPPFRRRSAEAAPHGAAPYGATPTTPAPAPPASAPAPVTPVTPAATADPVTPTAPAPAPAETPAAAGAGPSRDVLERARARLASLDTDAYPQAPVPDELLTQRPAPPVERTEPATRLTPLPLLTPPPAVRPNVDAPADGPGRPAEHLAPVAPPAEGREERAPRPAFAPLEGEPAPVAGGPRPPAPVEADDEARDDAHPSPREAVSGNGGDVALRYARLRNRRGMLTPSDPPQPSRPSAPEAAPDAAPAWFEVGSRPLPRRAPQRMTATTAAAAPGAWAPQRVATPTVGPPPPPEPDPTTGEVPPEAYRVWLREWLAYAESYDG